LNCLFVSNQGGKSVVELNAKIASHFQEITQADVFFLNLLAIEKMYHVEKQKKNTFSYEEFFNKNLNVEETLEYIRIRYFNINWSEVISAERSFTDYSYLEDSTGFRKESKEYVYLLVCNMVLFFEEYLEKQIKPDLIVCQTADTIFSNILFRLASFHNIQIVAPSPAWLTGGLEESGFLTTNIFYESNIMFDKYNEYKNRTLTTVEETKAENIVKYICDFDGNKAFYKITKKNFGKSPLSPNISNLISYILSENKKDKYIYFTKSDIFRKLKANLLRLRRFYQLKNLLSQQDNVIPDKSIFFPLHFQPEQSTLVSGAYYTNQIALIENISRSLPLGYTLIVKEHPSGRGTRSLRQYKQILSFYNVKIVDLPSKEVVKKAEAVITISGTIAMEALALNKPTIVFGKQFFSFGTDIFYHIENIKDLYNLLYMIVVNKDFENNKEIPELRKKFFLAYLDSLYPHFPNIQNASYYANYISDYYNRTKDNAK